MKRNSIAFLFLFLISLAAKSEGKVGPDAIFRLTMGCDINDRNLYLYLIVFQLGVIAIYTILLALKIENALSIRQYIIARGSFETLLHFLVKEIMKVCSMLIIFKVILYLIFGLLSGEYHNYCLYDIISTSFSLLLLAFFMVYLNLLHIKRSIIIFLTLFTALLFKIGSFYFSFLGWFTMVSPTWENNILEMFVTKGIFICLLCCLIHKTNYERLMLRKETL